MSADEDERARDRDERSPAPLPPRRVAELEDPRAAVCRSARYLRTGAPAPARASVLWSFALIVPFAQRRLSARFTQRASAMPFSKHHPEVLALPRGSGACRRSRRRRAARRHVERGREVDDDAVDLAVLERRRPRRWSVVDGGVCERADVIGDVVVARRPDLGAELVRPRGRRRSSTFAIGVPALRRRPPGSRSSTSSRSRRSSRARACTRPAPCRSRTASCRAGTSWRTARRSTSTWLFEKPSCFATAYATADS